MIQHQTHASHEARDPHAVPEPDALDETIVREMDAGMEDVSDVRWWDYPVFAVFWALMAVVFLQFFSRYVLNSSIGWTEEIARYLLIVLTFTGSLICLRKRSHIHLEIVLDRVSAKTARVLRLIGDLVSLVFICGLGWTGIALAERMSRQRLISLDLSRGVFYWIVTAALGLAAVLVAWQIVRNRGAR